MCSERDGLCRMQSGDQVGEGIHTSQGFCKG